MNTPQRYAAPCVVKTAFLIAPVKLRTLTVPAQRKKSARTWKSVPALVAAPIRVHFFLTFGFKRPGTAHPIFEQIAQETGYASKGSAVRMEIRMPDQPTSVCSLKMPLDDMPATDPRNWRSLTINPALWDGKARGLRGNTPGIKKLNEYLAGVVAKVLSIYETQTEQAKEQQRLTVTPASVKNEYLADLLPFVGNASRPATFLHYARFTYDQVEPQAPVYDALTAYIDTLTRQHPPLSPKTLSKWHDGANYLQLYLSATSQMHTPCDAVKVGWCKRFHSWLLSEPTLPKGGKLKMSAGTASRHVLRLKALFASLVDDEVFERNPLADLRLPKDKTRPVRFLERQHLSALLALPVPATDYGSALWWMKLMCVTGMDYPDAQLYAADPARYEQTTGGLDKIVINRSKPPFNECHIYMMDEVKKVMADRPEGLRLLSHDLVNWHIKKNKVAEQIGFTHAFTCKIARKTAGNYFLRKGFSIQAVSGIMGHDTIATTEAHYVKVTGAIVDQEAQNLTGAETPVYKLNRAA